MYQPYTHEEVKTLIRFHRDYGPGYDEETEWGCHVYSPVVDDREKAEQREKHRLFHCVLSTGKRSRDVN